MSAIRTAVGIMVTTLCLAAPAATVCAQICGDADENGSVTVTDGVQALRAAAGLANVCGGACDVDGSGAITVTDGVNILRKAAGFAIAESCDFTSEEANNVVSPSLSIFDGITKIPASVGSASTAAVLDCANDGTAEKGQDVVTFTHCQIRNVILDGSIRRVAAVSFSFINYTITHLRTGTSFTYNGTLAIADEPTGTRIDGTLRVVSSAHGPSTLEFRQILLLGDGSVRAGSLTHDLNASTHPHIARIQIDFTEADELLVTVDLRNGMVRQFTLDRSSRTVRFRF